MSRYVTIGRENHRGYDMPLYYGTDYVFDVCGDSIERYKVIFVYNGSGILLLNGSRNIIAAPSVLCLNEIDAYNLESSVGLEAEALWFHPTIINQNFDYKVVKKSDKELSLTERQDIFWLNPFCRRPNKFSGQLNIGPGSAKRIKNIINSIKEELDEQKDQHWPCRSRTYLIEMLFLLASMINVTETIENITLDKDPGDMREVILYLYSNYMNKITIQELTELFHINRTTLTRRFNEIVGVSVMEYLIGLRMYIAAQILSDTLLPITEVIERVGFNDSTHLGRMFKRYYGYSPTEYREKNCWMLSRM